jgi:hypothetical protein
MADFGRFQPSISALQMTGADTGCVKTPKCAQITPSIRFYKTAE